MAPELESRELGIDLSVYPNPADYQVKLYFLAEEEANAQVDIFDLNGRIVPESASPVGRRRQLRDARKPANCCPDCM